ncbi:penicillin-binding protein 2 [Glaciihabitans arcticus]|uniref:Penicillin-binding protein 2 n=2 Tax=Glaciihabitans arcticus TaxID=2668039 RepID=A0A4Q9GTX9_9MICO|nr:penicillin-binding protein 2 [Glaciihabitans arcticus]
MCVVGLFVGRLVDIQVVSADELNKESLGKRSINLVEYAARGDIVDSNGVILANSVDRFDIIASPKLVKESFTRKDDKGVKTKVTFMQAVTELAEATGEDAAELISKLTTDPTSDYVLLSKAETLDTLGLVKALKIPFVFNQVRPSRTYPSGAVAGNLVGFMGTDGPQAGLEKQYRSCLDNVNGTSTYERSSDGVRLPGSTVTTKEKKDGGTLKLTIDSDFTFYVQQTMAARAEELGADWATAAVVRVSDGHVMAMTDYPSVDPNNVSASKKTELGSVAFSTPYEPGSTMKPLTAAMLLDAGLITQTTNVNVPGALYTEGGGRIKDSFSHGDLHYTTAGIITNSSNIGISILSEKMSPKERREYFLKFGLSQKTAVGFGGESTGLIPKLNANGKWGDAITTYALSFGQAMQTTTAQVASAYQTLGNKGVRMPLTLVEGCEQADGTVTDLPSTEGIRVVSDKAATQTVQMMENVVTQGWLSSTLQIPGYRIAAKTGTAQVAENGRYGNNYTVSVAGLIPAEAPEYAVVVTFGNPDTMKTSGAAAPTFKKIMTQVIKTFRVTPSTKPAPEIPQSW